MNNVTLVGRTTKDMELKTLNSGSKIVSFCLAVEKRTKEGKAADFIDCVAWGKTAELVAQYVKKGDRIGLVGSISTRQFEDQQGNKRKAVEVLVDRVEFMSEARQTEAQAQAPEEPGELPFEI